MSAPDITRLVVSLSGLGVSLETHVIALGLSGALTATFPLCFAYISDMVKPTGRTTAFGAVLGIGMGGAYLVGPVLGSVIDARLGEIHIYLLFRHPLSPPRLPSLTSLVSFPPSLSLAVAKSLSLSKPLSAQHDP